jgi:hypothetical protein
MRQFISERKDKSIATVAIGYGLIAILGYALYRFVGFIFSQIEIPANIANLGIAAGCIFAILTLTALLLRADMKPRRKNMRVMRKIEVS